MVSGDQDETDSARRMSRTTLPQLSAVPDNPRLFLRRFAISSSVWPR